MNLVETAFETAAIHRAIAAAFRFPFFPGELMPLTFGRARHSNRKLISGDKRFIVGDDRDPVCNRHRSRCLGFRRLALHLGCLKIEQLTDL